MNFHGWVNEQKRGGNQRRKSRQAPNRMWTEGQSYQQFFKAIGWKRYIPVSVERFDPGSPSTRERQRKEQAERVFSQYEDSVREAKEQRSVEGNSNRFVANAWLSFTGWASHLSAFGNKDQIQAYIQKADSDDDDERRLEDACRGTRRLIRTAFATSRPGMVSKAALESVNRRETGADTNERPFYAEQQVKTIRKYSDSWVHILRYIWRTASEIERPRYRMTERQARHLEKLRDATGQDYTTSHDGSGRAAMKTVRRRAIEDACMLFWINMFDHELRDDEFESGIVSGLAVLGIDTQSGSWKSALNYTPILSAVVSVMRALVVHRAWRMRQDSIAVGMAEGLSEPEAKQQARSAVEGVDALVQRFMTLREFGGRISPMDRILRTRAYGLKIRMTTKASGTVAWMGQSVLVNRIRFSMDDIRTVVHGLHETVNTRLRRELLFIDSEHPLPVLDIGQLADNAAELSEGWNYLRDSRNQFPVDGERWMWRRLFAEDRIERRFVHDSLDAVEGRDDIRWNEKKVEDYFRIVRRFKEEIAVLVHLAAGSHARATELISIQGENGPEGRGQRGVFIENGMVEFVTSYHKGWSASKKSKIVHRYVPHEVGELVVYSMWLLDPWVRQLQNMVHQQTEYSPFVWEPKPEEDWKDREDEDDEGDENDEDDHRAQDEWSDDDADRPAPPTAKNVDGFWDTDRLRRVMQRETRKRIGVGIGVMDWRHAYPAIQRENTMDHGVREALDCIYDNRPPQIRRLEDTIAEQSGHSRYMEDMIYGLLLTESPTVTVSERNMFRKVSVDWHRFLGFHSAWNTRAADPIVQRQLEIQEKQTQMRRWKQMREVDVERQARRLYGDHATFRGVQKPALDAIVTGTPRVMAVMRTGGGKSWLFMLPAAGSIDGVTIVIVPTISLRQDFMDRCSRDGIPCAEWNGSRPPYHARIVLVTPESAVSPAFGRFIDEKRTMHQLERIVMDECHTILESNAEWRPKVLELCQMADKGVQTVFLTATLPPSKEPTLFHAVGVEERDMCIFRDITTRPNIAYRVVEYEKDDEDTQVQEIVETLKDKHPAPGQIIVYCKRIDQAKRLARILQCSVYHRTVGSEEEKKGILRRLTGQQERVFTATNALGLGVDAPTIRAVVHVGIREDLAQYAQESGRAGRDGLASEAIVMRSTWRDRNGQTKVEQVWRADPAMKVFLKGESCRRIPLDKHMDGRDDRTACEVGEERCDVCCGRPRGTKRHRIVVGNDTAVDDERVSEVVGEGQDEAEGDMAETSHRKRQRREDEMQAMQAVEERYREERRAYQRIEAQRRRETIDREDGTEGLRKHFESWQGFCVICHVRKRAGEKHQHWRQCPHSDQDREKTARTWDWLVGVQVEKYSGCRSCWAAQGVCHSWEDISHDGRQRFRRQPGEWRCQFGGVMRDAVAAVMALGHGEVVGDWVDATMAKAGMDQVIGVGGWESRKGWMGRKVRKRGVEMSGLCQMFWEFGEARGAL